MQIPLPDHRESAGKKGAEENVKRKRKEEKNER